MAVNEENAAGRMVVTAPTNGAAGVLPATLRYYLDHVPGASEAHIEDFLLTAAAIGGLVKFNASISGAEAGCQAEVGSAAAMSAAGLCAVLGGTLSALDGISPEDLRIPRLVDRVQTEDITEVILALNATVDGQTTAHYIAEMARPYSLQVRRIAHGVPLGGELEFVDGGTLSHAFARRHDF